MVGAGYRLEYFSAAQERFQSKLSKTLPCSMVHHYHHLSFKIRFVLPVPALLGTIFSIATLTLCDDRQH